MKLRLIKYWQQYKRDEFEFSNCSTNYEVLSEVFDPDAVTSSQLREVVSQYGYQVDGNVKTFKTKSWGDDTEKMQLRSCKLSMAVKTTSTVDINKDNQWNKDPEHMPVYFGLIGIPEIDIMPIIADLTGILSEDVFYELINTGDTDILSIQDIAEINRDNYLILESWDAFHVMEFLGYQSFEVYCKDNNLDSTFYDEVFSCTACNTWDWNDSGYTYNYRIVDCEQLGLNCGCHAEYIKDNALESDDFVNNSDNAIERDNSIDMIEDGKIELLETFIGGMTDGRGGWFNGESTREGNPSDILKEYQAKMPGFDFIFVHEESGQFQTYFSICKIVNDIEKAV